MGPSIVISCREGQGVTEGWWFHPFLSYPNRYASKLISCQLIGGSNLSRHFETAESPRWSSWIDEHRHPSKWNGRSKLLQTWLHCPHLCWGAECFSSSSSTSGDRYGLGKWIPQKNWRNINNRTYLQKRQQIPRGAPSGTVFCYLDSMCRDAYFILYCLSCSHIDQPGWMCP